VFFVLVLSLEDVALREVLRRSNEESLFNEEVARFLLGDADKEVTMSAIRQNF